MNQEIKRLVELAGFNESTGFDNHEAELADNIEQLSEELDAVANRVEWLKEYDAGSQEIWTAMLADVYKIYQHQEN